jgi:hypothetical protein
VEGRHFDDLTRSLASTSRRAILGRLAAGLLAALGGSVGLGGASANHGCVHTLKPCASHDQCCSGACSTRRGACCKKIGRTATTRSECCSGSMTTLGKCCPRARTCGTVCCPAGKHCENGRCVCDGPDPCAQQTGNGWMVRDPRTCRCGCSSKLVCNEWQVRDEANCRCLNECAIDVDCTKPGFNLCQDGRCVAVPRLSLAPPSGPWGQQVLATVSGFVPGVAVQIRWYWEPQFVTRHFEVIGNLVTDAAGGGSTTVIVPGGATGVEYKLMAWQGAGERRATGYFLVDCPLCAGEPICCPDGETCCDVDGHPQCCASGCCEGGCCCTDGGTSCGRECCVAEEQCCIFESGDRTCCSTESQCCVGGDRCCPPGTRCCCDGFDCCGPDEPGCI